MGRLVPQEGVSIRARLQREGVCCNELALRRIVDTRWIHLGSPGSWGQKASRVCALHRPGQFPFVSTLKKDNKLLSSTCDAGSPFIVLLRNMRPPLS